MNRSISQKKISSYREKSKKKKKIIKNEIIGGSKNSTVKPVEEAAAAAELAEASKKKAEPLCKIGKIGANGVIKNYVSKIHDSDIDVETLNNFPYPHLDTKKLIFPFDTSNWHSTNPYLKCHDSKWILKNKDKDKDKADLDYCIQLSLNISNIDCIFPEFNTDDITGESVERKASPEMEYSDTELHENYINSINNSNRTTIIKETVTYLVNNTDLVMDDFDKIQFEMEKIVDYNKFDVMRNMESDLKTVKAGQSHDTEKIKKNKKELLKKESEDPVLEEKRVLEENLEKVITEIQKIEEIFHLKVTDKAERRKNYISLIKKKKEKAKIETELDNTNIKSYKMTEIELDELLSYSDYDKNTKLVNVVSLNDFDEQLKKYFKSFRIQIIEFVLSKKVEVIKILCSEDNVNILKYVIYNGYFISHFINNKISSFTKITNYISGNNIIDTYIKQKNESIGPTKANVYLKKKLQDDLIKIVTDMASIMKETLNPGYDKTNSVKSSSYDTPWTGFRNEMNRYEDYFDWYISKRSKEDDKNNARIQCRNQYNDSLCDIQTHFYNKALSKRDTKEFDFISEYKYIKNVTLLQLWNKIFINKNMEDNKKEWFKERDKYLKADIAERNKTKKTKSSTTSVNVLSPSEKKTKKESNQNLLEQNETKLNELWKDIETKNAVINSEIAKLEKEKEKKRISEEKKDEITEMITELTNELNNTKPSVYVWKRENLVQINDEFVTTLDIINTIDELVEEDTQEDVEDKIPSIELSMTTLNDSQIANAEIAATNTITVYKKTEKDGSTIYINNETQTTYTSDKLPDNVNIKEMNINESPIVKLQNLETAKQFHKNKIIKYCSFQKKLISEILFRKNFQLMSELNLVNSNGESEKWHDIILKKLMDVFNSDILIKNIIDKNIFDFSNPINLNTDEINSIIIEFIAKIKSSVNGGSGTDNNAQLLEGADPAPVAAALDEIEATDASGGTAAPDNISEYIHTLWDEKIRQMVSFSEIGINAEKDIEKVKNTLKKANILDSESQIIDTSIKPDHEEKYIVQQYLFYCTKKLYDVIKHKILLRKIIDHYRKIEIDKCKNATDISFFSTGGKGDFIVANPLKYDIYDIETKTYLTHLFNTTVENSNEIEQDKVSRSVSKCNNDINADEGNTYCKLNYYQSLCFNRYFERLITKDFFNEDDPTWATYRTILQNDKKKAEITKFFNNKKSEFRSLCCKDNFTPIEPNSDFNIDNNPEIISLYEADTYYALTAEKMILFIDGIVKYELNKINEINYEQDGGKVHSDNLEQRTDEETMLSCGIKIITPSNDQINEINSRKNRNVFDKNASGWNGSKWLMKNDNESGQVYYQHIESGQVVYDRSKIKGETIENEGITLMNEDIKSRSNTPSTNSCKYFEGCNHKALGSNTNWNQIDVLPNQSNFFKSTLCEHHQQTDYLNKHIYFIQNNFLTMGRGRLKNMCVLQNCKDNVWEMFKNRWVVGDRNPNSKAWFYEGGTEKKQEYLTNLKGQLTNKYNQFKLLLNTYSKKKELGIPGKIKINLFLDKKSKHKINVLKSLSKQDINQNTQLFINPPKEPICISCLSEYRKAGNELTELKTKKLVLDDKAINSDNYKSVLEIKNYDYTNYFKNRCLIRSLNTYIESMKNYKEQQRIAEKEEIDRRKELDQILEEDNEACNNKFGKDGVKILLSEINTLDIELYYRDSEDLWINETNTINKTTERIFYSFSESGWKPVNKTIIEERSTENEEESIIQKVDELMEEALTQEERIDRGWATDTIMEIGREKKENEDKYRQIDTDVAKASRKEEYDTQSKIESKAENNDPTKKRGGRRILIGGSEKGYSDKLKMSYTDMYTTAMGAFGIAGPGVVLGGLALTGIAGASWYYGGQMITESKKRASGFYDMEDYLSDKIEYSEQSVTEIMKYQRYPMNYHIVNLKMFSMFLIKIGSEVVEAEHLRNKIDMINRYYKDKPNTKYTRLKLMRNLEDMHLRNIYYNKLDIFNPQKFEVKNIKSISNPCTEITYTIKSKYKNRGTNITNKGWNSFNSDGWGRKYYIRHNNWKYTGKRRKGTKSYIDNVNGSLMLHLKTQEHGSETLKDRWLNCLKKQKNVYDSCDKILGNQTNQKNAFKDAKEQLEILFKMSGGLTHPLKPEKQSIESKLLEEKNQKQPYYNDYWKKHSYEVSSRFNKGEKANERIIDELIDLICIDSKEKKQFKLKKRTEEHPDTPLYILNNIINSSCWDKYPDMRNNIIYNWLRLYSYNNSDTASIFQWAGNEYDTENNRKKINTQYNIFESIEQNIYLKSLLNILTMEGLEIDGNTKRKDCDKSKRTFGWSGYTGPKTNTENEINQYECGIKVIDPNEKNPSHKNNENCVKTYIKNNYSFNNKFHSDNYVLNVSERETSDKLYDLIEKIKGEQIRNMEKANNIAKTTALAAAGTATGLASIGSIGAYAGSAIGASAAYAGLSSAMAATIGNSAVAGTLVTTSAATTSSAVMFSGVGAGMSSLAAAPTTALVGAQAGTGLTGVLGSMGGAGSAITSAASGISTLAGYLATAVGSIISSPLLVAGIVGALTLGILYYYNKKSIDKLLWGTPKEDSSRTLAIPFYINKLKHNIKVERDVMTKKYKEKPCTTKYDTSKDKKKAADESEKIYNEALQRLQYYNKIKQEKTMLLEYYNLKLIQATQKEKQDSLKGFKKTLEKNILTKINTLNTEIKDKINKKGKPLLFDTYVSFKDYFKNVFDLEVDNTHKAVEGESTKNSVIKYILNNFILNIESGKLIEFVKELNAHQTVIKSIDDNKLENKDIKEKLDQSKDHPRKIHTDIMAVVESIYSQEKIEKSDVVKKGAAPNLLSEDFWKDTLIWNNNKEFVIGTLKSLTNKGIDNKEVSIFQTKIIAKQNGKQWSNVTDEFVNVSEKDKDITSAKRDRERGGHEFARTNYNEVIYSVGNTEHRILKKISKRTTKPFNDYVNKFMELFKTFSENALPESFNDAVKKNNSDLAIFMKKYNRKEEDELYIELNDSYSKFVKEIKKKLNVSSNSTEHKIHFYNYMINLLNGNLIYDDSNSISDGNKTQKYDVRERGKDNKYMHNAKYIQGQDNETDNELWEDDKVSKYSIQVLTDTIVKFTEYKMILEGKKKEKKNELKLSLHTEEQLQEFKLSNFKLLEKMFDDVGDLMDYIYEKNSGSMLEGTLWKYKQINDHKITHILNENTQSNLYSHDHIWDNWTYDSDGIPSKGCSVIDNKLNIGLPNYDGIDKKWELLAEIDYKYKEGLDYKRGLSRSMFDEDVVPEYVDIPHWYMDNKQIQNDILLSALCIYCKSTTKKNTTETIPVIYSEGTEDKVWRGKQFNELPELEFRHLLKEEKYVAMIPKSFAEDFNNFFELCENMADNDKKSGQKQIEVAEFPLTIEFVMKPCNQGSCQTHPLWATEENSDCEYLDAKNGGPSCQINELGCFSDLKANQMLNIMKNNAKNPHTKELFNEDQGNEIERKLDEMKKGLFDKLNTMKLELPKVDTGNKIYKIGCELFTEFIYDNLMTRGHWTDVTSDESNHTIISGMIGTYTGDGPIKKSPKKYTKMIMGKLTNVKEKTKKIMDAPVDPIRLYVVGQKFSVEKSTVLQLYDNEIAEGIVESKTESFLAYGKGGWDGIKSQLQPARELWNNTVGKLTPLAGRVFSGIAWLATEFIIAAKNIGVQLLFILIRSPMLLYLLLQELKKWRTQICKAQWFENAEANGTLDVYSIDEKVSELNPAQIQMWDSCKSACMWPLDLYKKMYGDKDPDAKEYLSNINKKAKLEDINKNALLGGDTLTENSYNEFMNKMHAKNAKCDEQNPGCGFGQYMMSLYLSYIGKLQNDETHGFSDDGKHQTGSLAEALANDDKENQGPKDSPKSSGKHLKEWLGENVDTKWKQWWKEHGGGVDIGGKKKNLDPSFELDLLSKEMEAHLEKCVFKDIKKINKSWWETHTTSSWNKSNSEWGHHDERHKPGMQWGWGKTIAVGLAVSAVAIIAAAALLPAALTGALGLAINGALATLGSMITTGLTTSFGAAGAASITGAGVIAIKMIGTTYIAGFALKAFHHQWTIQSVRGNNPELMDIKIVCQNDDILGPLEVHEKLKEMREGKRTELETILEKEIRDADAQGKTEWTPKGFDKGISLDYIKSIGIKSYVTRNYQRYLDKDNVWSPDKVQQHRYLYNPSISPEKHLEISKAKAITKQAKNDLYTFKEVVVNSDKPQKLKELEGAVITAESNEKLARSLEPFTKEHTDAQKKRDTEIETAKKNRDECLSKQADPDFIDKTIEDMTFENWSSKVIQLELEREEMDYIKYTEEEETRIQTGEERLMEDLFYQKLSSEISNTLTQLKELKPNLNKCEKPIDEKGKAKYINYRKVKFANAKKKTATMLAFTLNYANDMLNAAVDPKNPITGGVASIVDNASWAVDFYNGMNDLYEVLDPITLYLDPWLEYIRPYCPVNIKDVLWLALGSVFKNSIVEWQKQMGNVKENITTIKQLWQGCDALLDADGFLGGINLNMASKYLNKNIHRFAFLNALCRSANVRDQYNIFINNKSLGGGPFNSIKVPNGDVSMGTLDSDYIASGPYSTPVLKAAIDKGIFGKEDDIKTNYTYMANAIQRREEKYNELLGIDSAWHYGETMKKQQPYRTEIYDASLVVIENGENIMIYSFKHDVKDYQYLKWTKKNIKDIDEEKIKKAKIGTGKNSMSSHAIKEYDIWVKKKKQDIGAVTKKYVTIPVLETTLRWFEQQCTNDKNKKETDTNDIVLAEEQREQNITDCLKSVIKQREPGAGEIFSDGGTHLITLENCILHHSVNFLTQPIIHHSTVANSQKKMANGAISFINNIGAPVVNGVGAVVLFIPRSVGYMGSTVINSTISGISAAGNGLYSTYHYLAYEDPEPYTKYPFDSLEDWLKGEETKCGTDPNVEVDTIPVNQDRINKIQKIYLDHIGKDIPIILNIVDNNNYDNANVDDDYYTVPPEFIDTFNKQMSVFSSFVTRPPESIPTIQGLNESFNPQFKKQKHEQCMKADLDLKSSLKKIKRLSISAQNDRRKKIIENMVEAYKLKPTDFDNQGDAETFKSIIETAITNMKNLIESLKSLDGNLYFNANVAEKLYMKEDGKDDYIYIGQGGDSDNLFDNMEFGGDDVPGVKDTADVTEIGDLKQFTMFLETHIESYISQLKNILSNSFVVEYKNNSTKTIIPQWIPKQMFNSTVFIKGDNWGTDKIDTLREYMKGNPNKDGYGKSSCSIPGHRIQESINFESLYDFKSAKFYDTSLNNFKKSYKWNSINESELTIQNNTRINRYQPFSWFIEELIRESHTQMSLLNVNHTDLYKITKDDMKPNENNLLKSYVVYTQGSDWLAQYSNDIMTQLASNGKTLGKDTDKIMSMYNKHKVKLWKKKKEDESVYSQFINNEFPYNSTHDYDKQAKTYFSKNTKVSDMFDSWKKEGGEDNLEFFYKFTGRVKPIIWNINDKNEDDNGNPLTELTWRRSRIEIANKVVRFVQKNKNINDLISSIPAFLKTIRTVQNQSVWVSKTSANSGKLKIMNLPPGTVVKYNDNVKIPFYKNLNPYEFNTNGDSNDDTYTNEGWGLGEWIGYGWVDSCGDCYLKGDEKIDHENYIQKLEQSVGIGEEFKVVGGKLVNNNNDNGKVLDGESYFKYIATNLDINTATEWKKAVTNQFIGIWPTILSFFDNIKSWFNKQWTYLSSISESLFSINNAGAGAANNAGANGANGAANNAGANNAAGANGGGILVGGGFFDSVSNACTWITDTLKSFFPSLLSSYITLFKLIMKYTVSEGGKDVFDANKTDNDEVHKIPEMYYSFLKQFNEYKKQTDSNISSFTSSFSITLPSFAEFKDGITKSLEVVSKKMNDGFNVMKDYASSSGEAFFSAVIDPVATASAAAKTAVAAAKTAAATADAFKAKIVIGIEKLQPEWVKDPTKIKENIKSFVEGITKDSTFYFEGIVTDTTEFVKGGGFFGMAYSFVSSHIAEKLHTDITASTATVKSTLDAVDENGDSNDEKMSLCKDGVCNATDEINSKYESFKAVMEGVLENANDALDKDTIDLVVADDTKITPVITTSNNALSKNFDDLKENNDVGGNLISNASSSLISALTNVAKRFGKLLTGGGTPSNGSNKPFMSSKRMIHEHNNGPRSMQYLTDISNKIITNLIMHLWNEKKHHSERTDTDYGWNPQCIVSIDQNEVNDGWGENGLFSKQQDINNSWMKWLSCDQNCEELTAEKTRLNELNTILETRSTINVCLDENNFYHTLDRDKNNKTLIYFNTLWNKKCNPMILSKASDVDISNISISDDLKEYIHLCNSSGVNITMNPMNNMRIDPQLAKLKKQEFIRDKFRIDIEEKNECIKRKFERQMNITISGKPINEEIKNEASKLKSYWNMLVSTISDIGSEGVNISAATYYSKIYCGELSEEQLKLLKKYEENMLVNSIPSYSCISESLFIKMESLKNAYKGIEESNDVYETNTNFNTIMDGIGSINDIKTEEQTKQDFENGIKNNLERIIKESIVLADCVVNDCNDACKTQSQQNRQNEYKSIIDKNNSWLIDMKYYNIPNTAYFKQWQTHIFLYFIEAIIKYIDEVHNSSTIDEKHKTEFMTYINTINNIINKNEEKHINGAIGICSTFYQFKENVLLNDFKCCNDEDTTPIQKSKQNPFPIWFIQAQPHKNDFVLKILNDCHMIMDEEQYVKYLKEKLMKINWFQKLKPETELLVTKTKINNKTNFMKEVQNKEISKEEKAKAKTEIEKTFTAGRDKYDYKFLDYVSTLLEFWEKSTTDGERTYFSPLTSDDDTDEPPDAAAIKDGEKGWLSLRGALPKMKGYVNSATNVMINTAESVSSMATKAFDGPAESSEFDGMDELMNVYYKYQCENKVNHKQIAKNWSLMNKSYHKLKIIILKQIRKLNMYDLFANIHSNTKVGDNEADDDIIKKKWSRILVLMVGSGSLYNAAAAPGGADWQNNINITKSGDDLTIKSTKDSKTQTITYSEIKRIVAENANKAATGGTKEELDKKKKRIWKHGFSQGDKDIDTITSNVDNIIFSYYDYLKKNNAVSDLFEKFLEGEDDDFKFDIWQWCYKKIKEKAYFQSPLEKIEAAEETDLAQRTEIFERQKKDKIDDLLQKQKKLDDTMNKFKENNEDLHKATADKIYEIESQKIENESAIDMIKLIQGYNAEFDDEVYRVIEYYLDYLCSYSPDIKFIDPKLEHSAQSHGLDGDMNKINLTDLLEQNQVIEQQYKKGSMA